MQIKHFVITNKLITLLKINVKFMEIEDKKHCKSNPYSFIEKKEHAVRLAKIKERLKKVGIHRYTKEFHEYDTRILHDFMNSRIISFNLLEVFEKRLDEIENFISENKVVTK